MARPITLFTGQWADLPFDEVCRLAAEGPPEEEVGLAPFANPQFSAVGSSGLRTSTVLLPTPTFRGHRR